MHETDHILSIDTLAQQSKLSTVNPEFKLFLGLLSLIISISVDSYLVFGIIGFAMVMTVIYLGKLKARKYMKIAALPLTFLILSSIAILFQIGKVSEGIINIPFLKWYLFITKSSFHKTIWVAARAVSAVTCLFMISLTTPIGDVIGVLRRIKVPNIIIELMYLIYRYMMILIEMNQKMTIAASSRLGYSTIPTSYRSMFGIAANLLVLSFRKASVSFDAMEARGYDGKIEFWQEKKKLHKKEAGMGILYFIILGIIILITRL